jgi:hypothetical protein
MSSYYTTQQIVFGLIDKAISEALENKKPYRINSAIMFYTKHYAISSNAIKKRIEMFVEERKQLIQIKDNEVVLIDEEVDFNEKEEGDLYEQED